MDNPYALIILAALVGEYLLNRLADALNLGALRDEVPEAMRHVYDADRYRLSQAYTRARTRFGFVPTTVNLAVLLAFWLSGGFRWLDDLARAQGYGDVGTGLIFIGAMVGGLWAIGLPFTIYSTFVIEERFGFNKTTPATFARDQVLLLVLAAVIGGPLLGGILWFFSATGPHAWLWCWLFATLFSLALQYVAPTWIMPLFNTFTPLEEGELRDAIMAYADKVSFPLAGLFVIDGSRRSSKANAFFTGFGKNKRIALYDTLIEKHTTDELVAVLAHEVGHFKRRHIIQMTIVGILHMGLIFYLMSVFLSHEGLFAAFGVAEPSVHCGLVFFSLLFAPIDLLVGIALNRWSRVNEFEADAYARETADGDALIGALERLSSDSLSNLTPHWLMVWLHYSHPPLLQRIAALRA